MTIWPFRKRTPVSTEASMAALENSKRAVQRAKALELRAAEVGRHSAEVLASNHVAAAVAATIRGY